MAASMRLMLAHWSCPVAQTLRAYHHTRNGVADVLGLDMTAARVNRAKAGARAVCSKRMRPHCERNMCHVCPWIRCRARGRIRVIETVRVGLGWVTARARVVQG